MTPLVELVCGNHSISLFGGLIQPSAFEPSPDLARESVKKVAKGCECNFADVEELSGVWNTGSSSTVLDIDE